MSNRQTVLFLPVDPMDKNHMDLDTINLEAPRLAQYMHEAWKKHQKTVYWVDINLAVKKGLKFYQTRSNAIILHETLPAFCIPKVVRMENWRSHIRESICVTSSSSKDFLETCLDERIGFRSCSATDGQVVQKFTSSESSQPNPNPDHDRTVKPVVCPHRGARRSQEIETRSFPEEAVKHDRTGTPVVCRDTSHAQSHDGIRIFSIQKELVDLSK